MYYHVHDGIIAWSKFNGFRFVLFTVFELQGSKLNNNSNNSNNNKKQKNWENELFVISPLLVMQC